MKITISHKGNFGKIETFFKKSKDLMAVQSILSKYGKLGVELLSANTPIDSGLTANSWDYQIDKVAYGFSITWTNSNVVSGVPLAILLQYGHGTRNGGYVQGRDFINPSLKIVFEKMADNLWEEVTKL